MDFNNLKIRPDSISTEHSSVENAEQYHSVLLDLKKMDKADLHVFLKKVLDVVSNSLDVERVSIWFFNEGRTSIYCDYLYLKKFGEFANETTLSVEEYPNYFKAIGSMLYVAADDARTDINTFELSEKYSDIKTFIASLQKVEPSALIDSMLSTILTDAVQPLLIFEEERRIRRK